MKKPFSIRQISISSTIGFGVLAPLILFGLLCIKGLPPFAVDHPEEVLFWLYTSTGVQSLLAGGFLSGALVLLKSRWGYFIWPYDFGRSASFGAVAGAILYSVATVIVRVISGKPYSDFWIAGALMAGCLAGSILTSLLFWRISKNPLVPTPPSQ